MNSARNDEIIQDLYANISSDIVEIIEDPSVCDFLTLLDIVCNICAMVELLQIGDGKLKGEDKKNIVIRLGRILIEKHSPEEAKDTILATFDETCDIAIDKIIFFAKNNKVLKKKIKCSKFCLV